MTTPVALARRAHRSLFVAFVVLAACALRGAPVGAGVSVAIQPALVAVAPDEELVVELAIDPAGSSFNGFDAVVEYDPSRLTFLPSAPVALQQGELMTDACGNTFHRFAAAADSLTITDVLLCAGVSVTGPGPIYRLRFKAGAVAGSTWIRLRPPRTLFYAAGLYVFPVTTADAEVVVADVTGAGDPPLPPGLSLRAWPNPSRGDATFELGAAVAGPVALTVVDARGRRVRTFAFGAGGDGERRVAWDGRDERGHRVPAGVYTAHLRGGSRVAAIELVVLR